MKQQFREGHEILQTFTNYTPGNVKGGTSD